MRAVIIDGGIISHPPDAAAYRAMHRSVCSKRHPSDECTGVISIDRKGVTLRCPACGNIRQVYEEVWPE